MSTDIQTSLLSPGNITSSHAQGLVAIQYPNCVFLLDLGGVQLRMIL